MTRRWNAGMNTRRKDKAPTDRREINSTRKGTLRNVIFDSLVHAIQYELDGCIQWTRVSDFESEVLRIQNIVEKAVKDSARNFAY